MTASAQPKTPKRATVAALWRAQTEIDRLRDLLRLVADEPNIDKARALADRELHGHNVRGKLRPPAGVSLGE